MKLTNPRHIQAAVYSTAGAHYLAHRDNKPKSQRNVDDDALWLSNPDQRNRHLTCVLYLTPCGWDSQRDGGALRCYVGCAEGDDEGYSATHVVDIEPLPGRLVVFPSDQLLHEVRPLVRDRPTEPRIALTIWLLRDS